MAAKTPSTHCLQTAVATRRLCIFGSSTLGFAAGNVPARAVQQAPPPTFEKNEFVQKLLERSRANKEKYDKERLESYYKRNFPDYFQALKRNTNKNKELSEVEQKIDAWLEENKTK